MKITQTSKMKKGNLPEEEYEQLLSDIGKIIERGRRKAERILTQNAIYNER